MNDRRNIDFTPFFCKSVRIRTGGHSPTFIQRAEKFSLHGILFRRQPHGGHRSCRGHAIASHGKTLASGTIGLI